MVTNGAPTLAPIGDDDDSHLRAMRSKQGMIAMNEVMGPTKTEWLKSTSELLVEYYG